MWYTIICLLMSNCATTNRTVNRSINNAIIGENEIVVYQRLGIPYQTIVREDGSKVWIYKSRDGQLFSSPNDSWHASTHAEQLAVRKKRTFNTKQENITIRTPDKTAAYELNNDKAYTSINPFLRIYFNRHGKCVKFNQDMSVEQRKLYNERLKQYSE